MGFGADMAGRGPVVGWLEVGGDIGGVVVVANGG